MTRDEGTGPRTVTVPSRAAAAHLLLAVHATRVVLGRSREPGVEAWLGGLRAALTAVLTTEEIDDVLQRCQAIERDVGRAA